MLVWSLNFIVKNSICTKAVFTLVNINCETKVVNFWKMGILYRHAMLAFGVCKINPNLVENCWWKILSRMRKCRIAASCFFRVRNVCRCNSKSNFYICFWLLNGLFDFVFSFICYVLKTVVEKNCKLLFTDYIVLNSRKFMHWLLDG